MFAFPEPQRGGMMVARGKAAEAAALGKEPPHPTYFFPAGLARLEQPAWNVSATAPLPEVRSFSPA